MRCVWAAEADDLAFQAETIREELERKAIPGFEEEPVIEGEPEEAAIPEELGPKFLVKRIEFETPPRIPLKEFEPILREYENRELHFRDLQLLAKILSDRYRQKGFITSRVFVPPQKIENGIVRLQTLEGRLGEIYVEGTNRYKPEFLRDVMEYRMDETFRVHDLEAGLIYLNQLPELKTKAYLINGATVETTDVILKAEEAGSPGHLYYEFHNRGSKSTHLSRHVLHWDYDNLSGYGDPFNVGYILAEEGALTGIFYQYRRPFHGGLTNVSISGSRIDSIIVNHLKPFEIEGESSSFTPSLSHDWILDDGTVLGAHVDFEIKDSKVSLSDFKSTFDRSRALVFGPTVQWKSPVSRTYLALDTHWGVPDFLGASSENDENVSKENTGGNFMYYTGSVDHLMRVSESSFLTVRLKGQWTRDTLMSLEQFRLGGANSVRGYPESDSAGDYGYQAGAEYVLGLPASAPDWKIPFTTQRLKDIFQTVFFLEGGKAFMRERASEREEKDRFLLGTGLGIRLRLSPYQTFQLDWGYPLGDESRDEDRAQYHLSLKYGF